MAKSKEVKQPKVVMPIAIRNKIKDYWSKLSPENYMALPEKKRKEIAKTLDTFIESLMVTMPQYFNDKALKEAEVSRRARQSKARV
jgi:hypothetical protein